MVAFVIRRLVYCLGLLLVVPTAGVQYVNFLRDVGGWLRDGRIKYREDITDGLENAPRELIGLLRGENFGKKIIRVSSAPTQH